MPVEVFVVGAGPSGLFSAIELARHGVQARVVERDPQPHHQARATTIQPGTLELLSRAGVGEAILTASEHLRFARVLDPNLQIISELDFAGAGCEWEYQCALPQWRTEQILTERLGEFGVMVERGVTARSVQSTADGVRVRLERADGTTEVGEASWVIGAGGAHSITRASMHEELAGDTYPGAALVGDVRVRGKLPRDGGALIASAAGYVLLAPLPEDRWITFIGDLDEGEVQRLGRDTPLQAVAACMEQRLGANVALDDVAWAAPFRMHHRLSRRLAGERRFLLGDAGHLSSPFGGEGLNSGLHDGCNLGWKLGLAARGHAGPELLESFEQERVSADRHVLEVSGKLHALAHAAVESARTGVRPAPPPPEQVAALVRARCMLDVEYADSPLVGQYVAGGADTTGLPDPGVRYPKGLELAGPRHHILLFGDVDEAAAARLRDRWAALVDLAPVTDATPSALLIRPDGYVGFRAVPADAAGIEALDAHLGKYLFATPRR